MVDFFGDIFSWIEQIPPFWAYVTILLIAYGENLIPPVPGDMVVVYGGYLAGIGKLDFFLVVFLATVGGSLGFMTMYAIGHRIGDAVMEKHRLRWLPKNQIRLAHDWLARWGNWVVAANRFLSGARSIISLSVGMARIHPAKTAGFATLSAFVWTTLISYGGLQLGENWPVIGQYLRTYGAVVLVVALVALLAVAGRYYIRWRRAGARSLDEDLGTSPRRRDQ